MRPEFTLVQLRYFAAVARREHMTAAAAELNVTQSTLSSAIAQLEREFGVPLFERLPRRGLRLTPAGHTLLARSAAFLEEAELISRSVREETEQLTGELVVGMYSPLAPFRAPVLLQHFERLHPHVNLVFLEGDQGSLQQALLDGHCELALMYDLGVGERFSRRLIEQIPPHAIVPADHPIARSRRREISLLELAEEPLILLNLPHTREYYLGLFKQLGVTPRVRHVSLGYETVRSFVALGHGYSLLNHWVGHGMTYAGDHVVPIRLTDPLPPTEASLVRLRGARPTRRSLAFEEVCLALAGRGEASEASPDATRTGA
ncbi:LysR family transcriptional regulator [Leucobacter massiliensis]|uniref:LysR family transcriptional regulator n=1 Tax=Leucobacter massiliensis TaxID=1686285 RepID=A0A2S9QS24_9MICO|nr:LysR family transcriptional regulator [Leucobacter massiliensis]PRI12390.1 LysR family transcriptional regulator [Leucobacter massiliensis]